VRDSKQKISRSVLDTISQRATPAEWARYTVASTAIHLINKSTTRQATELKQKMYINERMPQRSRFLIQPEENWENNVSETDWTV